MKVYFKGWLTVLALALAALVMITLATQPARAAGPWYVAPGGSDSNSCTSPGAACATISGAIAKASSGDTIYVATGMYTGTGSEVVRLYKNVTLSGGWDASFTTQSGTSTIDGEGSRRGMTVNGGVTAIVERFVVQNGSSDWVVGDGGGISNSGILTLNSSAVNGNRTVGAFIVGGGIYNVGTMTLNNSVVSGNMSGGIYSSYGTMAFNNSTVSDNMGGGIYSNESIVTLNNSTVSGNMGGGIRNSGGTLAFNNSTFSDNVAHYGAGIDQNGGTVILNNCTVSGNTANVSGGGISKGGGTMILQNTILAGNASRFGISPDCSGEIGTLGYNLIGDTSGCNFTPGTGDLTDVGANLGELIGIPGAPMYRPLLSGSPAIDAGNPAGCTGSSGPLLTDQRGVARPQGPACDIGAYEYTTPGSAASIYAFGGTPQTTPPSFAFWMPLQAAVLDSIGSPVNNATVIFSAPGSGASGTFADSGTFTTTAVTDESGGATASTFTANGLTGSYAVTATVGGVVIPTNFLLGNIGWYVAPGGNDGNDCQTPATTCATINGTLSKAGFTAGDTVLVAVGTYTGTGDEVVLLDKSVRLLGGWNGTFSTQSGFSAIDGEGTRRGITLESGVIAIVECFDIQNGSADTGGGIQNDGTLTLNNSAVSGSTAANWGGGICNYGALILIDSTVSGNSTGYRGGGIENRGTMTLKSSAVSGNTGGGILNDGTAILNGSIVSGNTGGGINGGPLTLNGSIVSGNTGGGINGGPLTLNNSTVSGNTAFKGGGIYNSGDTVTLNNSTVSNNVAQLAGGIFNNSGQVTSSIVTLQNSILAGNTGGDCIGTIGTLGYNLIGNTSSCLGFTPGTGDLTNIEAKLGPLEGSPGYHPLLLGSPAIDAGNPAGCTDHLGNPLPFDQRGMPRMGRCDIGAVETQELETSNKTVNIYAAPYGASLTYAITLRNISDADVSNVVVTDTVPVSLTYNINSLSATAGSYDYANGVITWTGSVNAGGAVTITFRATISQTATPFGSIVNSAVISGGGEIITRIATVYVGDQICNLTKHAGNPVLSIGAEGRWDDDGVWGPAVLKEDSSYKMWYTGYDGVTSRIGYAISPDGINWTKEAANPVLSPSESWEAEGIRAASVISDSGLYKMWYTGLDSDGVSRIGYATSTDGVTWTKDGGNPVLDVGASGSWEDDDVSGPTVIKAGGTYHIWYTGDDGITPRIGHVTSSDGINWIKDSANPVLDIGPPGDWDWLDVYGPSVVAYNDVYLLWYSGGTLPEAWQTGYALSSNGSDWTRQEMLIPEGASGSFDADSADYPSVIVDGTEFKVWYSGLNDSDTYNIGYATAEICSEVSPVPPANPVYLPIVLKSGIPCPPYYTDDFSDPDSGWPIGDNSNFTFGYISNQYQIRVKNPPGGFQVTPGAKATDFAAAVSARRTSGAYGAYGIHFGINEDWSEYYEVVIDTQDYSIWKYDNGIWTPLRDWTTSGYINTGTSWNRLKVIRDGANIAVYVNNHHLATVTDGSFTGLRRIGLYAGSFRAFDARFDNFSLYPASCGVEAAGVGFEMGEPGFHEAPMPPGLDQSP